MCVGQTIGCRVSNLKARITLTHHNSQHPKISRSIQASVEDRAVRGYPKSYQVFLGYSANFKVKVKVIHFLEESTVPKLATAVSQSKRKNIIWYCIVPIPSYRMVWYRTYHTIHTIHETFASSSQSQSHLILLRSNLISSFSDLITLIFIHSVLRFRSFIAMKYLACAFLVVAVAMQETEALTQSPFSRRAFFSKAASSTLVAAGVVSGHPDRATAAEKAGKKEAFRGGKTMSDALHNGTDLNKGEAAVAGGLLDKMGLNDITPDKGSNSRAAPKAKR